MTAPAAPLVHVRALFDWITPTYENEDDLAELLRGPEQRLKHGWLSYLTSQEDGHGTLLACGAPTRAPSDFRCPAER